MAVTPGPELYVVPGTRYVIEVPGRLNDAARKHLRATIDDWCRDPDRPLVLEDGLRLRTIDRLGRVSPDDRVAPWPALLLVGISAGAIGSTVGVLVAAAVGVWLS